MLAQATLQYLEQAKQTAPKFEALKLFQWELRKRKPVTTIDGSDDELPWEGIQRIVKVLQDATKVYFDSYYFGHYSSWKYIVPSHPEYAGTLVKRLRKYFRNKIQTSEPVSNDTWGEVGSIVGEYQTQKVWYDFTDRFDWRDGQFGDEGSCFMSQSGCRSFMRRNLEEHGCHAIRFYKDADVTKGIARAILVPHNGDCVVINSYGYTRLKTARILSQLCGLEYRAVSVENYGGTDGDFWINDGRGIVITDDVEQFSEDGDSLIDFEMDIEADSCCSCGESDQDELTTIDGEIYCHSCCSYCDDCEEYHTGENYTAHDSRGYERYICGGCIDNYTTCPCCNNLIES